MRRLAFAALLPLLAACFDEGAPTAQVGGTQFNLRLVVPSPVRAPSGGVSIFQRSPATLRVIDSVTVTNLALLEPLEAPARYQFWVVNALDGSARPVRGAITRVRTDTTFGETGTVTTSTVTTSDGPRDFYAGAPLNTVATVKIGPTQSSDSVGQTAGWLVLTIQADSSAPAFTATTPKPLWFRLRDQRGTADITDDVITANGNLTFGTWVSPTVQRPFTAQGFGRGAVWDQEADGRLVLSALAFGTTQPPLGYHYVAAARNDLIGRVTRLGEVVDANTGESQFDADLRPVTGSVAQMPNLRFMAREDSLVCGEDDECAYPGLAAERTIQLLLEPKLGSDDFLGVTGVLQGQNNFQLVDTRERRGIVKVTTTHNGVPIEGVRSVLYATGRFYATAVSDSVGVALFKNVVATRMDVRVIPPSGMTIADQYQRDLLVPVGDTLRVTFQLQTGGGSR